MIYRYCLITSEQESARELGELAQYQGWDETQTVRPIGQMELGISERKLEYKTSAGN